MEWIAQSVQVRGVVAALAGVALLLGGCTETPEEVLSLPPVLEGFPLPEPARISNSPPEQEGVVGPILVEVELPVDDAIEAVEQQFPPTGWDWCADRYQVQAPGSRSWLVTERQSGWVVNYIVRPLTSEQAQVLIVGGRPHSAC